MLQQYGTNSSLTGTSPVNGNTYNIALSPLFFVRGGYINPSYANKFNVAGQDGYYWSSRAYSSASYAYLLNFGSGGVNPSSVTNRYSGLSLRCLISTP